MINKIEVATITEVNQYQVRGSKDTQLFIEYMEAQEEVIKVTLLKEGQ